MLGLACTGSGEVIEKRCHHLVVRRSNNNKQKKEPILKPITFDLDVSTFSLSCRHLAANSGKQTSSTPHKKKTNMKGNYFTLLWYAQ